MIINLLILQSTMESQQEGIIMSQIVVRSKICVSPFHFIIWIFFLEKDNQISYNQRQRIKVMYGVKNQFNPAPRYTKGFDQALKYIHASNKKAVIKVVTNKSMAPHVAQQLKKDQNQIIDIFIYSPNKQDVVQDLIYKEEDSPCQKKDQDQIIDVSIHSSNKLDDIGDLIFKKEDDNHQQISIDEDISHIYSGYIFDLDQTIARAEREVQKYTKQFRTFNNAQFLLLKQAEKINRYRYKLVSFIKLKISDYKTYGQKFQDFADEYFQELKNMEQTRYIKIKGPFNDYLRYSKDFMQKEEQLAKEKVRNKINKENYRIEHFANLEKQQQNQRINLYRIIISLYKQEDLFYHLMNTSLRALNEELLADWEVLAIPFYQLYSAIKYFYKKKMQLELKDEVKQKFYTSNFTVYRGGRIRKSQFTTYMQYQSKIFIQFFGFTSTTLNPLIAIDKFIMAKNLRDQNQDINSDERCVFKIQAKFNEAMCKEKYDFLIHGFYKFDSQIENGESEKQVLFGPLNIFQLFKVQKMTIRKFLQLQKQLYPQTYKQQDINGQIVVVYLKFGSFFDILFDDNRYNLTQEQKMAKANYIFCMNSINKYEKFDFADFYQLNKQPIQSFKYLETKTKNQKQQDQFLISELDNKNYFARMSQACIKQGKNRQALQFNKISIMYYEQLESINLNNIYNSHYQKYFNMKMEIIQFYQGNSNYISADLEFKRQLQYIQSKQFQEANGKLRRFQIIINQGVNNFSIGKIQQSINRFQKCQQQIKIISNQVQEGLKSEKRGCLVQYLMNIFCCGNGSTIWGCFQFFNHYNKQKQQQRKILKKKLKDVVSTESKIEDLLMIAKSALQMMMKVFKNQEQYQDLIKRYNQQITFQMNKRKQKMDDQQNLKNQLEQIRQKVFNINISTPQYEDQLQKLEKKFKQLKNPRNLRLYTQSLLFDATETKYIEQYIKKEKQRRKQYQQKRREEILKRNQQQLIQFYIKCSKQIDEELSNLKNQCYDESTTQFLKELNEKARIMFKSHNHKQALQNIKKIDKKGRQQGQYRNYELAMAYMTKTKILLQFEQYEQSVNSVNFAIQQYERSINCVERQINNSQNFQVLKCRNEYLQLKIMKVKSLLFYIYQKNQKEDIRNSMIQSRFNMTNSWKQQSPSDLLIKVFDILIYLDDVITSRTVLQNISQIQADFKQMQAIYSLVKINKSDNDIEDAFKMLDECFAIRDKIFGLNNSLNFATCSDIIFKFHNMCNTQIKQHNYLKIIDRAFHDFKNCRFYWKVAKAYYLIENQRGHKEKAIYYLSTAVRFLERQTDKYLQNQRQQLRQILNRLKVNQDYPQSDLSNNQQSATILQGYKSKDLISTALDFYPQNNSSATLILNQQVNSKEMGKQIKGPISYRYQSRQQQQPSREQIAQTSHLMKRNKQKLQPIIHSSLPSQTKR